MGAGGDGRLSAMHYVVATISGVMVAILLFLPLGFVAARMFEEIDWMAIGAELVVAALCLAAGFSSFSGTLRHYRGGRRSAFVRKDSRPGFPVITQGVTEAKRKG